MFKWILLGVYVLGLLLFVGTSMTSKLAKRKLLSRILSIVSTLLMTSWSAYTFIMLIRTGVSPTFFDILYTTIVTLNLVFNSVLFILAILGELDLCSDSNESSEDN